MPKINVNRKKLDTLEIPEKYHKRMNVVIFCDVEKEDSLETWCKIGEWYDDKIFCYIPKSWLKFHSHKIVVHSHKTKVTGLRMYEIHL